MLAFVSPEGIRFDIVVIMNFMNLFKFTRHCFLFLFVILSIFFFTAVNAEDKQTVEIDGNKNEQKSVIPDRGNYYWVVYDNVCPYCRSATKHIKSLDWEQKFKFISYRDPLTYKMFPELSKEECEKDVHMVTPKGEVLSGYKVFRTVIDNLTATKVLNPLLKNDYAEKQLNEIYEKMVKERTCYYNKTGTCDLKKTNPSSGITSDDLKH